MWHNLYVKLHIFGDKRLISILVFDQTDLSPMLRYIELLAKIEQKCVAGSEQFLTVDDCLFNSNFDNNVQLIPYFINKGPIFILDYVEQLCLEILIDYFVSMGANDLNRALECAGRSKNLEIIEYLISLGKGACSSIGTSKACFW